MRAEWRLERPRKLRILNVEAKNPGLEEDFKTRLGG
jgi:hypothetical protein